MKRIVLLIVAFVLIAGGSYGLLIRAPSQPEVVEQAKEEFFPAWRAVRSLEKGEPITVDDLQAVTLNQQQANSLGITTKEKFSLIKGSLTALPIMVDSTVTQEHVVSPDHPDYVELLLSPGMVAYPVDFQGSSGYPLVLSPGDSVDVVLVSSLNQNLAKNDSVNKFQGLSVAPLLRARKVLKVGSNSGEVEVGGTFNTTLVLELTRGEVSQMMLAKRVGVLDFNKSTSEPLPQVRAGDVLPDFSAVTELRGVKKVVN